MKREETEKEKKTTETCDFFCERGWQLLKQPNGADAFLGHMLNCKQCADYFQTYRQKQKERWLRLPPLPTTRRETL